MRKTKWSVFITLLLCLFMTTTSLGSGISAMTMPDFTQETNDEVKKQTEEPQEVEQEEEPETPSTELEESVEPEVEMGQQQIEAQAESIVEVTTVVELEAALIDPAVTRIVILNNLTLQSTLNIGRDMTLSGDNVTLYFTGGRHIRAIDFATILNLDGITLDGKDVAGGIIALTHQFTLVGGTVQNCKADYGGGIQAGGSLIVVDAIIQNNNAASGGGLFSNGIEIRPETILRGNTALQGGGAFSTSDVMIGGIVEYNEATQGGGIFAAQFELQGGTIRYNNATRGGGIFATSLKTYKEGRIYGNTAENGGGIWANSLDMLGLPEESATQITGNTANQNGGGVYINDIGSLYYGTISGNTAINGDGGGVYTPNLPGLRVISGFEFSNNKAGVGYQIAPEDIPLHDSRIFTKQFTSPFQYGYNNYDISYTGGTPVEETATITYDANGGEGTTTEPLVNPYTIKGAEELSITKFRNVFFGWSRDKDSSVVEYRQGDVIDMTEDMTLYAVWKSPYFGSYAELLQVLEEPVFETIYAYQDFVMEDTVKIDRNIQVQNDGEKSHILTSAEGVRHFTVPQEVSKVTFAGLTLDGNEVGGGIDSRANHTLIENMQIKNCLAVNGGGIYGKGNLEVVGSTISHNKTISIPNNDNGGAGIYSEGELRVMDSNIINNAVDSDNWYHPSGGGILSNGKTTIGGESKINGNTSIWYGGGIYANGPTVIQGFVEISENNSLNGGGGGIFCDGDLDIDGNVQITKNYANLGGGIHTAYRETGSRIFINGAIIEENEVSGNGGGINSYGELTISGASSVSNNIAQGQAAGIYSHGRTVLNDTTSVSNNLSTNGYGAGIFVYAPIELNDYVRVSGNSANSGYGGGGIYASTEAPVVVNDFVIIENNFTTGSGGGIWASRSVELNGSAKVINNESYGGGGGIFLEGWMDSLVSVNDDVTISGNVGAGGGGIKASYVELTGNATISGNTGRSHYSPDDSVNGGGIAVNNAVIRGAVTIADNTVYGIGGGIAASSEVDIQGDVTISGNTAKDSTWQVGIGGGITSYGQVRITGSAKISDNTASHHGGGIFSYSAVEIHGEASITGNIATEGCGGGIYVGGFGYDFETQKEIPVFYYDSLNVGEDVIFERNVAKTGYLIAEEDIPLYNEHIKATAFTEPFDYGYNNFDIGYTNGRVYSSSNLVTFDTDGGLPVPESQNVSYGEKAIEPQAPMKDGAEFIGWFIGEKQWDFAADTVTDHLTLTAKYKYESIIITYDANGGEGGTSETINPDENYTVKGVAELSISKDRSVFFGWALSADSQEIAYEEGDTLSVAEDITLFAIWKSPYFSTQIEFQTAMAEPSFDTIYATANFALDGTVAVNRSVQIESESDEIYTITSGQNQRHFEIQTDDVVLEFEAVTLDGNGIGGGIKASGNNLTLKGTTLKNCHTTTNGGAVYSKDNELTIVDSLFWGNFADKGGAIAAEGAKLKILGNTSITQNTVSSNGGALYLLSGCETAIEDQVVIKDNHAPSSGGGIYNLNGSLSITGDASIADNEVLGLSGRPNGGGIYHQNGYLNIKDRVSFSGNSISSAGGSTSGGGIYAYNATVFISDDVNFTENGVGVKAPVGGGIAVEGKSQLTVSDRVKFVNNIGGNGGNIYAKDSELLLQHEVMVLGGVRSGLSSSGCTVTIKDNVLFSGNTNPTSGGGINSSADKEFSISGNVKIIDNSANNGAGAYIVSATNVSISGNVLIAENTGNGVHLGKANDTIESDAVITDHVKITDNKGVGLSVSKIDATISGEVEITDNINPTEPITVGAGGAGGVSVGSANVTITDHVKIANNFGEYGGGVFVQDTSGKSTTIKGSVQIENNTASSGAGIYITRGELNVTENASITNNIAQTDGGGVFIGSIVVNSTLPEHVHISGQVSVHGNQAQNGAGVFTQRKGKLSVSDSPSFSENIAKTNGGAICATGSQTDISGGVFLENSAAYGAGIYSGKDHVLNVSGQTRLQKNSGTYGAGIYMTASQLAVSGSVEIKENTVISAGGAIYTTSKSEVTIQDDVSICDNTSGIYVKSGNLTISDNVNISGNIGNSYAGIYISKGNLSISGSTTIASNQSTYSGGGIYASECTVELSDEVLIAENSLKFATSNVSGGGMYLGNCQARISDSVSIINNHALNGGGLSLQKTELEISGSVTISGNEATNYGGGLYMGNDTSVVTVTLSDQASIFGNKAGKNGGGVWIYDNHSSVILQNQADVFENEPDNFFISK